MHRFYNDIVKPCFEAAGVRNIVEIGCDRGENTVNLIEYCRQHKGTLHIVDPMPRIDVDEFFKDYKGVYVYHKAMSLNAIWKIHDYDVILIDGDHNYYTVYSELNMVKKNTETFPLVLFHDIGWPYDRRDLYYDVTNIPEQYVNAHANKGIDVDTNELTDKGGFNAHLDNSLHYNNDKCGVLTAVEDFMAENEGRFVYTGLPLFNGLGILYDKNNSYPKEFYNYLKQFNFTEGIKNIMRATDKLCAKKDAEIVSGRKALANSKALCSDLRIKLEDAKEKNRYAENELRQTKIQKASADSRIEKYKKEVRAYKDDLALCKKNLEKYRQNAENFRLEYERYANSFRYNIGCAMADAMSSPVKLAALPFRLASIMRSYRKKKVMSFDEKSVSAAGFLTKEEPEPDFLPSKYDKSQIININKGLLKGFSNKDNKPLVSIIILNHNGIDNLKTLFNSFESCDFYSNYEVILIDNASSDGSVSYVKGLNNSKIRIIKNSVNESFSKANNDGAKEARGEYLLFLNNDIEVTDGWLDEMLEAAFKNENCGCVGAKLVYPEIPDNRINKGKSFLVQHNGIAFKGSEFEGEYFLRPYNKNNAEDVFECSSEEITEEIAVTAACLLVKKEIFLGAGGFDEGYVYGYEDVDLCLKIHRMGYKNCLCPTALLFHYEFGTQINSDRIEVSERRTANTHLFMSKWQKYIKENIFREKLNSETLFGEKKLKVAFCVTEAGDEASAGDYFTAMELALSLEKLGYEIKYLTRRGEGDWYDVGQDVDVLISMLDSYDINMMKNAREDIVTIAWARNWFERWVENPSFYEYSLVFASSPKACDYILKETGRKAELFPIASNHERFKTENIDDSPENKSRFEADYVFTGSYWNSPREIIDIIAPEELPYSFKVFGKNWEDVPSMAAYTGGFVNYKDIPSVYKYAKIVVDDANAVTKEYGAVNSRVYDALAAGCLVITNGAEGSEDIFNNMLPVFRNRSEFLSLVDFYMKDEKARNEKINELRDFVLKNHTYDIRAKQLKNILKKFAEKDENKIAIMAPVPKWSEAESWGDYHFAKAMKKCFDKQGYETEIRILPQWEDDFDGKYVIVLRGLSVYKPRPEHINIMWNISHPDDITVEEYNQYDKVYISSVIQAERIKKLAHTPVEPLLQCTDPDVFKPRENAENKYELLFVGNSRKVMRKIIKDIIPTEYSLSVFGTNWEGLIDDDYIKGENIPNRLLGEEYASCSILLNDHWEDMSRKGFISNRIFDGLACGAFIISDEVEGLEDVLEGCVVTYKDKKDLAEKIDYYMKNPEERRKIAQRGMEAVRSEHTFEKRMAVVLNFIKEA